MCFNDHDMKIIQSVLLNKFNINTTIHSDNRLYIKANSKETFKNLIKPYVHTNCKYKL